MPSVTSLSTKQAAALRRFLKLKMGESIDELAEEIGQEDAFTLILLHQRLERAEPTGKAGTED